MKKIQNDCVQDETLIYYREAGVASFVYEERGLANLQYYGNSLDGISYQDSTEIQFNTRQQRMYKRLLYGTEAVSKSELATMTNDEAMALIKKHLKAQKIINRLKNEIVAASCDRIFKKFWNSDVAKEMLTFSKRELDEPNNMTFTELGITKFHIADKLVEHGLLPVNFYQLSA